MVRIVSLTVALLAASAAVAQDEPDSFVAPADAAVLTGVLATADGVAVLADWGDTGGGTVRLTAADGAVLAEGAGDGPIDLPLDYAAVTPSGTLTVTLTTPDGDVDVRPLGFALTCSPAADELDCTITPVLRDHFSTGTLPASDDLQDLLIDAAAAEGPIDLLDTIGVDDPARTGEALTLIDAIVEGVTEHDPDGLPDPLPCECYRLESGQGIRNPSSSEDVTDTWSSAVWIEGRRGAGAAHTFTSHLESRRLDFTTYDESFTYDGAETVGSRFLCTQVHFRWSGWIDVRHPHTDEVIARYRKPVPVLDDCDMPCTPPDATVMGFGTVDHEVTAWRAGTSRAIASAETTLAFSANGAPQWTMSHHDEEESGGLWGGKEETTRAAIAPHVIGHVSGDLRLTFEGEGTVRSRGVGIDDAWAKLRTSYAWAAHAPATACTASFAMWGIRDPHTGHAQQHCDDIRGFFGLMGAASPDCD